MGGAVATLNLDDSAPLVLPHAAPADDALFAGLFEPEPVGPPPGAADNPMLLADGLPTAGHAPADATGIIQAAAVAPCSMVVDLRSHSASKS